MTFKKKHHASYSQRNDFWQDVDMDEYHMSDIYREKVDAAWDQHKYLWDERTKENLWDKEHEKRTDNRRTNGKD